MCAFVFHCNFGTSCSAFDKSKKCRLLKTVPSNPPRAMRRQRKNIVYDVRDLWFIYECTYIHMYVYLAICILICCVQLPKLFLFSFLLKLNFKYSTHLFVCFSKSYSIFIVGFCSLPTLFMPVVFFFSIKLVSLQKLRACATIVNHKTIFEGTKTI